MAKVQRQAGRDEQPSAAIVDSQFVKTNRGACSGFDGHKKVKGRNPPQGGAGRHLMVDVLGLALKVYVEAANSQDREGLKALAMSMKENLPRLNTIFADQGYTGECTQAIEQVCGWKVEITKRSEAKVFEVQRKRWVVERTFGWFIRERRLSKDYEYWPENSESMIYFSMIRLMLRRLAPAA